MSPASSKAKPIHYGVYILSMLIFGTNGYFAMLTLLVLAQGGFDREAVRSERKWLILGGAALGANWVALFEAYRLLNVSLATLIYYVGPMLVLLLSPMLFREQLTGRKIAAICLVAVGLICISGSIAFGGLSAGGLVTAIVSALFYSSLIIFNKRIVRTSGMQTAAIELDVAFVVVLVYVLLTVGLPHPEKSALPYILVIGLVNTGLAYLLYFSGLQKLPGQSVALISYVDPVSALLFSAVLLHETMTPVQLLGAVLIIGGAMFGELRKKTT